jgi:hypothetical protein
MAKSAARQDNFKLGIENRMLLIGLGEWSGFLIFSFRIGFGFWISDLEFVVVVFIFDSFRQEFGLA